MKKWDAYDVAMVVLIGCMSIGLFILFPILAYMSGEF